MCVCVHVRVGKDMHSLAQKHSLAQSGMHLGYWKYVFDQGSLEKRVILVATHLYYRHTALSLTSHGIQGALYLVGMLCVGENVHMSASVVSVRV